MIFCLVVNQSMLIPNVLLKHKIKFIKIIIHKIFLTNIVPQEQNNNTVFPTQTNNYHQTKKSKTTIPLVTRKQSSYSLYYTIDLQGVLTPNTYGWHTEGRLALG